MKTLVVILGPTCVGKSEVSLQLAEYFQSPILSADSRQIYKGLAIGTAAPTITDMQRVQHYFVGTLELFDYYNARRFEDDAIRLLAELHKTHDMVIMSGGSMMYIDAVCNGIDDIPTIDATLRSELRALFEAEGLESIQQWLKLLDPVFYQQIDLKNPKRVIHALEVCLMSGKPYSCLRTNRRKKRPFRIIKVGLIRNREELYVRINCRAEQMVTDGLLDEARRVYPYRHFNALNTVGYKEIFLYFDGVFSLEFAVEKIKQNSRIYARKQMTWFKRDKEIIWFHPNDIQGITDMLTAD